MNETTDQQLVCAFAERKSEAAFSELVRRHVDFVYSAALRTLRDTHLAQDVTQGTFIALAQNCAVLTGRPVLAGWLHRTVRNLAGNTIRSEVRRRAREQEAATMNELLAGNDETDWEKISPELDAALEELGEEEREALLLRYFQKKTAQEIAVVCDISAEAAQKRVSRAVDRLREVLNKKKVSVGASALAVLLSANALQAAPTGLAALITASGATIGASSVGVTLIKGIGMTLLQKSVVGVIIAVTLGAAVYSGTQSQRLKHELAAATAAQGAVEQQLIAANAENKRLNRALLAVTNNQKIAEAQQKDLLRLRRQSTTQTSSAMELARLKASMTNQQQRSGAWSNIMGFTMAQMEAQTKKAADARLRKLNKALNLTDDQYGSISNIIARESQQKIDGIRNLMMGNSMDTNALAELNPSHGTDEITAMLTPEQATAYKQFQKDEQKSNAEVVASYEISQLGNEFDLTEDQKARMKTALINVSIGGGAKDAQMSKAISSGNLDDMMKVASDQQMATLDKKVAALSGILTADQLEKYREEQIQTIKRGQEAAKMLRAPAGN